MEECVIGALLVLLVICAVIFGVERVGAPSHSGIYQVAAEAEYRSAYTTIVPIGKVMVPQHHPEQWSVPVDVDGDILRATFGEDPQVSPGDQMHVQYGKGRLSGQKFIQWAMKAGE